MSQRDKPPFRADHVGSLLRPRSLLELREGWRQGEVTSDELREVEDEAVREAVALQAAAGLQGITDGEFRRDWWHLDFLAGFEGIELAYETAAPSFASGERPPVTKVVGKVRHGHGIFTEPFKFLAAATSGTAKLTIPGPALYHLRPGRAGIDASIYPDLDRFWDDVVVAYRAEIQALYDLGLRYLQIDDVSFAYLCDATMRNSLEARGDDPDATCALYVDLINRVIADRPPDLVVTTHMCRGNFKSSWVAQGGYEAVAEAVFGGLKVDGLFLEYDSDRAGGFEPLRFVRPETLVVVGLITSKTPELEDPDRIVRRLDEASRHVPLDRLCLSPQCGFSSTYHGNALTADDQRRKLDLTVALSQRVWG
ncbi:MAG: 5-methyltetrahydropteroyltriglutamate--homocysteine S-methyltransferase [Alphaproteobacteria bacterium]